VICSIALEGITIMVSEFRKGHFKMLVKMPVNIYWALSPITHFNQDTAWSLPVMIDHYPFWSDMDKIALIITGNDRSLPVMVITHFDHKNQWGTAM